MLETVIRYKRWKTYILVVIRNLDTFTSIKYWEYAIIVVLGRNVILIDKATFQFRCFIWLTNYEFKS